MGRGYGRSLVRQPADDQVQLHPEVARRLRDRYPPRIVWV